jgi:two-component system, OmpR family, response regulator
MAELPKPTILCVDDTATEPELHLLTSVLERAGYQVLATRSPLRALEFIRHEHVDLVLTEHIVPPKDGPAFADTVRRLNPYVPIAVYSGNWAPESGDLWIADRFITKLVSVDELLGMIEELMTTPRTQRAA